MGEGYEAGPCLTDHQLEGSVQRQPSQAETSVRSGVRYPSFSVRVVIASCVLSASGIGSSRVNSLSAVSHSEETAKLR